MRSTASFLPAGLLLVAVPLLLLLACSDEEDGTTPPATSLDAAAGPRDASGGTGETGSSGGDGGGSSSGDGGDGGDGGGACACTGAATPGSPVNLRGGDTATYTRAEYDYAPTVMHDGATFRMWWCGGVAGDHVLHAEATTLAGPWHGRGSATPGTYDDVLQPTGNAADFDGLHTCDPSVVRVGNTYYLYYGGLDVQTPDPTMTSGVTRVGLATSTDGLAFTRANAGKPIVGVARSPAGLKNQYGAGQPSVTYVDAKYWLVYTDTTGLASNVANGGGQYVLRSSDPTFQTGVEELTATGFATAPPHTGYSLLEAFSVDWMYVARTGGFLVATTGVPGEVHLRFFPKSLSGTPAFQKLVGSWTEGAGLVADRERHAETPDCAATVPVDLFRSVGTAGNPSTWDLGHLGADVPTGQACAIP